MPLTAVALVVLLTTCFVRGQANLLSTNFKPPPPLPTQQTAAQTSFKQPFHLPPLLPPPTNQIYNLPFNNQQTLPSQFPSQFPSQYPSQQHSQFPSQHPPSLPPQLQSQLPIQLPQHLQQQIPFKLQPPFPIQTPPPFPPHVPPFLHNNLKSTLLPPQFPPSLPTKFPPPPPPPPPPKTKFQLPPPKPNFPPFRPIPVHPGTRNVSIQANRSPRTLQMIGSNNGQSFPKITDNLRPGAHTWHYKKNSFFKRPSHAQAPQQGDTTPPPLFHAPRLIPLNQFNQLEQITKLNQQNQPNIQTSLNHWSLLNNQHLNSLNSLGSSWNSPTSFHQGPQLSNLNSQNLNSQGSSLKGFNNLNSSPNVNNFKSSNNNNPNNHGSTLNSYDNLSLSPSSNNLKSSSNQNLNIHGSSPNSYTNLNSLPNLNNLKSPNHQNLNSHGSSLKNFDNLNSLPSLNNLKSSNNQNLNSHGTSLNSHDNLNSSPNLNNFKPSNNLNLNNHGSSLKSYDNLSVSPNSNNLKSSSYQNLYTHGASLNSYDSLNSLPNLNNLKSSNNQNFNSHGSPLKSFENLKPLPSLNNLKSSSNQNLNSHGTSLNSYDSLNSSPNLNNLKTSNNHNLNNHGSSLKSNDNLSVSANSNNLKSSSNHNLNIHGSSLNSYDSLNSLPNLNTLKSSNNQNFNSHGSSLNSYDNLNSLPNLNKFKSASPLPVSSLHTNVQADTKPQVNNYNGPNQSPQSNQQQLQFNNLNQSPFTGSHTLQNPYSSHQQAPSFYPHAPASPITPPDVYKDPSLQISAVTIPEPETPQFETLRSQVSALKAKNKEFFNDHNSGELPQYPSSYQSLPLKPVYGPPKPVYGPPPPQQSLLGKNPWTPLEQNKLTSPKRNPLKFDFQYDLVHDYEQYNAPKKTLPLKNDFVGFPPAKGSINNDLNYISNWEKGIGIIHKTDLGNAEKGQTIISAEDMDDFNKNDKSQNKQESSKVEITSMDKMQRRMTGKDETAKKQTTVPKKMFAKGKKGREKQQEQKLEEMTLVKEEASRSEGEKMNETQMAEARYRRKRDIFGDGSTTESIVVSPENVNTAAPLEAKIDFKAKQQPRAEPLMAPATESMEAVTEPWNVEMMDELPHTEALTAIRQVGDLLDSSEESELLLSMEDDDFPHAEALTRFGSAEGDILSDEDLDEANAEGLAYDDYDDAYLDDENYEPSFQPRLDSFIFEEQDGTTSRPYAMPVISERIDNLTVVPQSGALIDPRKLHGRALMDFLDEAIRNSSLFLPDEAEDRSFDVVDPPKDVIKFPYYDRTEPPINVDSALRFAENLTAFSKGLYESKNGNQCHEVDIEIAEEPAEPSADGFLPIRRLKRLGNKVDCLKNKHFGKEPLDNPLFKEEFVGGARSTSDSALSQPDPSVAVFSDVIRLIKQHLNEEQRSKARDFNDVVTPRHLNLSDTKNPSPNNAVLEQLRLGTRRPLLPNKQTKRVEEPKLETNQNTTSDSHGLKIVFPRRLNITKTYNEAKKASMIKAKLVDIEGYKAKLNHSRLTDHEGYKATLARKLNFDKLDKSKIPKSQRRDSDDGFEYESVPRSSSRFTPVFDITSFYPRLIARADDGYPYPTKDKGFATKYDELEHEADELISSVRKSSAEVERRIVNSGNARAENSKKLKDKPYGTSYSPSYQQYRLLSRKDDQKRTPTVDELVDFYSQRRSSEKHDSPSLSLPSTNLPIFDVTSFYPRFSDRGNDDLYQAQPSIKRKGTKITLDDLEVLQAPKRTPKTDSSYNPEASKPKQVRDDIADFFEGSQSQPAGPTASGASNEGHHTFKKSEPPNPGLPETDKATFHLDQPATSSNHQTHRLHPVKVVPRKRYKTKAKNPKQPPLKYRRKKVFTGFFD